MDERLKRLVARREAAAKERDDLIAKRKAIVDLAEEESRDDLNADEDAEFRDLTSQIKAKDEELRQFDERITELSEELQRSQQISEGALRVKRAISAVQVISEARTYERGNGESYLRDLTLASLGLDGSGACRARLERHAREVETDKEFRTTLNRTDGQGGYFVPPLWVMQEYIELARAGRATANLVTNLPLPSGTDSINIPKVATGATTAPQNGDNTAISNTDMTDTYVAAPVRTVAGEQDVAVQLLEQSPANFDEVIFRDLIAAYATNVGTQVISGTGSNGEVKGILSASGTIAITWTEANPSVPKIYGQLADAIQRVHSQRFAPPQVIVMHPRRWGWITASLDTTHRPLVVPNSGGPMNAAGVLTNVDSQQVVGTMHGLPVVTDPNIPLGLGGGESDQDVILIMRASDHYLYESSIRTRVVVSASGSASATSLGARTLTSTLQVYGYIAFTAERYPKSTAKITGTGLETPDFAFVEDSGE
mgnify:CR=1 FL=1